MVSALPSANLTVAAADAKRGVKLKNSHWMRLTRMNFEGATLSEVHAAMRRVLGSPCIAASGLKKIRAAARPSQQETQVDGGNQMKKQRMVVTKSPVMQVYSRQKKRKEPSSTFFDQVMLAGADVKSNVEVGGGGGHVLKQKKKLGHSSELMNVGTDVEKSTKLEASDSSVITNRPRIRKGGYFFDNVINQKGRNWKNESDVCSGNDLKNPGAAGTKKWVWLSLEGTDPNKFTGLRCKVYWPLDAHWYCGCVVGYNPETRRHQVKYDDEEEENLILENERIKFHISDEEIKILKFKSSDKSSEADGVDVNEMMVLIATLDDCQDAEPEDIVWAKLTGHAIWPAIVLDESQVTERKGLHKVNGEKSFLVQFFGTHDIARITQKQVLSFLKGLLSSCHLKFKKPTFVRALEEAKVYLSEQKLPKRMLQLQNGDEADKNSTVHTEHGDGADSVDEECQGNEELTRKLEDLKSCQLESGELQVISLG